VGVYAHSVGAYAHSVGRRVRIQWVHTRIYLLLLLFFSEVVKDITPGKEKPHAGKPQPAWGTWERIIKVLGFGQEYSLRLGLIANQEHHQ
jgi:hypothetical protein